MTDPTVSITADWETFEPRTYLENWYSAITPEITATVDFVIRACRRLAPGARAIDFCSGPTFYQHIAAAPYVAEIHASDFLQCNLDELRQWRDAENGAFDWSHVVAEALRLEGDPAPDAAAIAQRTALVRQKLTDLRFCDIRREQPLGPGVGREYDALLHCYGADVVADSVSNWETYIANTCAVLKPGGTLAMTLIKNATWWPSGDQVLGALALNEADVRRVLLRAGFDPASIVIETHAVADAAADGYRDVIFVSARLGLEPHF